MKTNQSSPISIQYLNQVAYIPIYQAMQEFTENRHAETVDELWILEHFPVYTLGMAGKLEHLLNTQNIPVIKTDRGGQVTYHGLGQLIVYILIDIKRKQWPIKQLVNYLEQAVINYLNSYDLFAERREKAPGVYIHGQKIAALGLRIKKGCSYHGLSLNVNIELAPFSGINPCGYAGLEVTRLWDFGVEKTVEQVSREFLPYLLEILQLSEFPLMRE